MQQPNGWHSFQQGVDKTLIGIRKDFPKVFRQPCPGLGRSADGTARLPAEEGLRGGEQGPPPPVAAAVAVMRVDEILRYNIAAHLEPANTGVELPARLCFRETADPAQITDGKEAG